MVISMDRWVGKVAIVTGASAGIGSAITEKLVKSGLIVVGLARRLDRLEELSKKLKCKKGKLYPYKADLTKEDEIIKAFDWTTKKLGPVHILINNAGLTQPTSLSDGDTEMWKRILDTNVIGLCIATREAVKIMKANKIDGHIININSLAGHQVPVFPMNIYPASKFAVTALTETLRQEFNRDNVRIKITSLSPGATESEFIVAGTGDEKQGRLVMESLKTVVPFMRSEDVADAVLFALSTPPHIQIQELTIAPVGSSMQADLPKKE